VDHPRGIFSVLGGCGLLLLAVGCAAPSAAAPHVARVGVDAPLAAVPASLPPAPAPEPVALVADEVVTDVTVAVEATCTDSQGNQQPAGHWRCRAIAGAAPPAAPDAVKPATASGGAPASASKPPGGGLLDEAVKKEALAASQAGRDEKARGQAGESHAKQAGAELGQWKNTFRPLNEQLARAGKEPKVADDPGWRTQMAGALARLRAQGEKLQEASRGPEELGALDVRRRTLGRNSVAFANDASAALDRRGALGPLDARAQQLEGEAETLGRYTADLVEHYAKPR
jgi:hypothetical protein